MAKKLLILWVIIVIGFTGYKVYEYFSNLPVTKEEKASDEEEKPVHTLVPSSNKFFTNKKVYTNEDIKKLRKKKEKDTLTNEDIKIYHKD